MRGGNFFRPMIDDEPTNTRGFARKPDGGGMQERSGVCLCCLFSLAYPPSHEVAITIALWLKESETAQVCPSVHDQSLCNTGLQVALSTSDALKQAACQ